MKFLIQKVNDEITHDFSFTLIDNIKYNNWLIRNKSDQIKIKYLNTNNGQLEFKFKNFHKNYIPIGSVEFVSYFLKTFHNIIPKPINVPVELFEPRYSHRPIFNGNHNDINKGNGRWFVKSNDKIKGTTGILNKNEPYDLPIGNYQFSDIINVESEWRSFVYKNKLVGLQNYSGDFTLFPNVELINEMIFHYKSAPIVYTLDIGVNELNTFVVECHDFFSVGLYGFNDKSLPFMFSHWYYEYIKNQ